MKAKYLSPEEINAIFRRLSKDRRLVFSVALETGLRIGDVLKIKTRDLKQIAPDALKIAYIAQKTKKKGSCILKGQTARELLFLAKFRRGFLWGSNAKCGHITRQTAWNWFKEAAKAAEIDVNGVSPHALRKSFAVKLLHEQGIEAAKTALQHSDNATTAIYAYADVYAGKDPNAPVLWCQVDQLVDLIASRLRTDPPHPLE